MSLDDLFKKKGILSNSSNFSLEPTVKTYFPDLLGRNKRNNKSSVELKVGTIGMPLIKTGLEYFRESIDIGAQRREEITAKYEHNERIKQFALTEDITEPNFGPVGCDEGINNRINEALGMFRKATKDKILAQFLKFNIDDNEKVGDLYTSSIGQYFKIAELCSEKEERDIKNERLRRILIMDAYESIGDIIMLPWYSNLGRYQNAITVYTELKEQTKIFLEWICNNGTYQDDKKEAEVLLFNTHMSLASLHLLNQDLDNSCKETVAALKFMKSLKNPQGIDYSEFIPFEFRTPSYATKRFSNNKRDNHELPYLPIVGEVPLPRQSLIPKSRKKFVESILRRRLESESSIISGHSFKESVKNLAVEDKIEFDKSIKLKSTFRYISLDPTNTEAYVSFFFLEKSVNTSLQTLFKTAKRVHDKILLEKAETGNFDLIPINPDYSDILTDGEELFKKEPNEDAAKKHIAILRFLTENSKLSLPCCELCQSDNGDYYVKLELAKNIAHGKSEREFSACTLEDMTTLYKAEVNRKKQPTEKEMSEFRKKKLKQAIDTMIEFSSAGKERRLFIKYSLDISDYDYHTTLEEKVFKRLNLDEQLKERAKMIAIELTKQNRILSHCDFHCGNILAIENEQITIIDPISTSYANRFFDLAYLLEQNVLNLSEEEKSDLIDYFVGELGKNGEIIENPQQAYNLNAAFVNLRIAGAYSRESKELGKKDSAKYTEVYIQQAKNALKQLSDSNML